ncbi:MAG: TRAM domain-containing protein [Candidatus Micrarchaeia archaeon]
MGESIVEGGVYELKIDAKGAHGEGIGKIGDFVVFVKNAKTRIGNIYKVRLTKAYRTFGYAELHESGENFVGNGSMIDLTMRA